MKFLLRFIQIIIIVGSVFVSSSFASEDSKVDSLASLLFKTNNEKLKLELLLELADKTSWTDIKSSEKYARQALELSRKLEDIKGLAYSNFWLAKIYGDYEFDLAENLILQSLEHAMSIQDSILMARGYNLLGNLKSNLKFNEDALSYYNRSLGIFLRHDQDSLAAGTYNNLGISYAFEYGDSLSINYYQKAASININNNNYLWLAINYLNIGNDYLRLERLSMGYEYLQMSMEIANEHQFIRLFPWIYNNLSNYYLKSKNFPKALELAKEGLNRAKDQSNRLQELYALEQLKEISQEMSDLASTNFYLEDIIEIKDSISKYNRLKELDLLEMRYKFEEEQKAQVLEKALLEAKYYRKEVTYLLILLIAGVFTFTFLSLYIFQRNRNRRKTLEQKNTLLEKEKLSKNLEFRNKELTTNVMYLLKKNEFISNISSKLKNIDIDNSQQENDYIRKIIIELDKSISDDNWEDFEVRFQEVHVGFYNSLSNSFPDLTPNELRLCAFLRLNMTTKEIADITFQSAESIKKARYRLRKKLNLNRDDNLVTFLSKM
ncbi:MULTISPECIES: hypothetical protein [unclassified Lentimicrobium]|uniref:tetratricopeptide repeat protein n=1 Tax=unclassified Lentimicrobium TaxID=2677434 RepID=UPI0015535B25|nr:MULTISPECIES: hypothetical protein [unclassified Lentimicrobium]NPD46456.1 hypothetical protein [Lentimicrobium sp. S6]NPD84903.1 hypothetical protein [Lentimicrobium sp. L6]